MGDNMDMTRMSRNEDQVHRTRNTPRPRKERRDGWYSRWDRGAGRRGVKSKARQLGWGSHSIETIESGVPKSGQG